MALKRLIIIRPGQSYWNFQGRWQGWVAVPLDEHGRAQVQRLANFIRNIGLTALYSSDLRRATDTVELLEAQLGFEPVYDERLRERNIGCWQGLTVPEIHGWYPQEYAAYLADPEHYEIPGGGESLSQVKARVRKALRDIIKKSDAADDNQTVGIISHTTAIRMMLAELVPEFDQSNVTFGNTSVTTLVRDSDGNWKVIAANDCTHLEGLESRYMPEVEGEDL